MNAPLAIKRVDLLKVLKLRSWARGYLWMIGELDFDAAVDKLQCDAVRDGLVARIGQDEIQRIMTNAFKEFCDVGA